MSVTESDRVAYVKDIEAKRTKEFIRAWLRANPEIGELYKPKGVIEYYVIVDQEPVKVTPPPYRNLKFNYPTTPEKYLTGNY